MRRAWQLVFLSAAAILLPAAAFAENIEDVASRGAGDFSALIGGRSAMRSSGMAGPALSGLPIESATEGLQGRDDFGKFMREHSQLSPRVTDADASAASAPVTVLDLAHMLNKQWKTNTSYKMGGQTAYISGSFDRQQNAFVSVYVDGWNEPKFFNIKGLLDKEGSVEVGGVKYTVSLSANPIKPLKSQIVFENAGDENDSNRLSVKKLLDDVTAAGATLRLSDQSYQVFYYNDVKDGPSGPVLDPASKTFCMVMTVNEEMHVFLIPAETVPADKIAVFKMFNGKRVGLQFAGGALKVYENP